MKIRDAIGRINFMANRDADVSETRRAVLGAAAIARKGGMAEMIRGVNRVATLAGNTIDAWREPEEIADGMGGFFDVCDLRAWLAIAERADVPAVPARTVLSMSDDEYGRMLGTVDIPDTLKRNLAGHVTRTVEADPALAEEMRVAEGAAPRSSGRDPEALFEATFEAMEGIPPSWMVRSHLGGSSNLKSLVGTGLMLKGDDTAQLSDAVALGAGWVQVGNRRGIDFRDKRFRDLQARGHKDGIHFLARPWATPARFHEGEDLHRKDTPLEGAGHWPAEWRIFVKNGAVTGVANYYGWTGDGPTPENAWNAIEAAGMARRLVEAAVAQGLSSGFMDTEFLRQAARKRSDAARALADWEPDGFHATIDFIETTEGMRLLEAGPPHAPGGGGHPTAFAGQGVDPRDPARVVAVCEGVAYKAMPHVHLAEPRTWVDGDPDGYIEAWRDAAERACRWAPLSADARALLLDKGHTFEEAMEP